MSPQMQDKEQALSAPQIARLALPHQVGNSSQVTHRSIWGLPPHRGAQGGGLPSSNFLKCPQGNIGVLLAKDKLNCLVDPLPQPLFPFFFLFLCILVSKIAELQLTNKNDCKTLCKQKIQLEYLLLWLWSNNNQMLTRAARD